MAELALNGERWAEMAFLEYARETFGKKQITWSHGAIGYGICALLNKESVRLWHSLLLIVTGFVLQLLINFTYLSK